MMIKKLFLTVLLMLCATFAQAQACTSTLSSGADIGSAINGSSGGDVICLNAGSYGNSGTTSINTRPASRVTIRSTNGVASGVTVNLKEIYRSTNLAFVNISMSSHQVSDFSSTPCTSNLTYRNVIFVNSPLIIDRGCSIANANILISGATFSNEYQSVGIEGSLYLTCQPSCDGTDTQGVTIEHSLFEGNNACADGIQLTALHSGVMIGPGNIFRNWHQSHGGTPCGPHVDAVQQVYNANVTITGNYFYNNVVHLGFYDGAENTVVTHNVFDTYAVGAGGNDQSIQIGGVDGMNFSHNTLRDGATVSIGSKAASSPNANWVFQNNLAINTTFATAASDQKEGCGSGCVGSYNMLASGSSTVAEIPNTNAVTGTPTFTTSTPGQPSGPSSSWGGWRLTGGSAGKSAGSDGKDVGTNFFNPAAPTSFQGN